MNNNGADSAVSGSLTVQSSKYLQAALRCARVTSLSPQTPRSRLHQVRRVSTDLGTTVIKPCLMACTCQQSNSSLGLDKFCRQNFKQNKLFLRRKFYQQKH